MTNTDTADADGTAIQVARLAHAGSQLVRVTVNTEEAAAAVPEMVRKVRGLGVDVPIIGDFHYNGHKLLVEYPETAALLAKYRINPGNVGAKRHDEHFATIVKVAIDNDKPVRIGVNWGSLDQAVLTELMDANAVAAEPRDARDVMIEAMLESAMRSAELAEATGMRHDRIILSAKVSGVRDLVDTYRRLATRSDYPLHLGLTEAGMGDKGVIASTAGLSILLNEGIGDTIRVSLTPEPGAPREREVEIAQQVLQSMGLRSFLPQVSACPGCGRTTSTFFQEMAQQIQGYLKDQMPDLARDASGRRGPARRGHGLRGERAGRVEARRHRDLAAGHLRGAGGAGLHRREARPDAPRRRPRGRVHRDPRGVRRRPVPDPCADPLSPPVSEAARRRDRAWPWLALGLIVLAGVALRALPLVRSGALFSGIEYDDGVYLTSAALLVSGHLPYTEFTLLHPPGIAVLLAAVRGADRARGRADGRRPRALADGGRSPR